MKAVLKSAIPVLATRNVISVVDFWTNQLGFTKSFIVEKEFAGVYRDDVTLYISSVEDQIVADNTQAWIRVRNIDTLFAEWSEVLSTEYADISQPAITQIFEHPWGREFAVRDPAGNCVHFMNEG